MSVIDTIEQAMRRNLEANAPPLSGTPIAEADHADLLDGVLDASALTLADARVERDGDAVLVHGRADLFGRSSLDVALGFEGLGGDGCAFLLRASLSDLPALAALAASIETPQLWWSIGPLGETFEDISLPAISDVHLTTILRIGEAPLPITIFPPGAGEPAWRVEGTALQVPLPRLDAVAAWLGLGEVASLIPPPLANLGGMVITGVGVAFRPEQAALDGATVTLATPAPWSVAGGKIAIEGLTFSLGYARDPASGDRTVDVSVRCMVRLGDRAVAADIAYDAASRSATLDFHTEDGVPLPSLQDIAVFVGNPRLLDGVPTQLTSLKGIIVKRLAIAIDTGGLAVNRVELATAAETPIVLIPPKLALESARFSLIVTPGAGDTALTGWGDAVLAGAGSPIPLQAVMQRDLTFSGSLTELRLTDVAKALIPDLPPALADTGVSLQNIYVSVSSAGHLAFEAEASFDFHTLAAALGVPLPEGLAAVHLDRLALDIDAGAGTWSLSLATAMTLQLPDGAANHLAVSDIQITLAHDGGTGTTVGCRFVLDGDITLSPDVSVAGHGIDCSWQSGVKGDWSFGGTIEVVVLGTSYPFEPKIEKGRFQIRYVNTLTLAHWPDLATVDADGLSIGFATVAGQEVYAWSLSGAAHFDVVGLKPATGTVTLANAELEITATVPEVPKIVLPLPPVNPSIDIELKPLRLVVGGGAKGGPTIEAGATVTPSHIPAPANVVFPNETMGGSLRVDERGFALTFISPGSPKIDVTFARGTAMEVHFPGIEVQTLRLDRIASGSDAKKRDWNLGADLRVSGLAQLNRLFGDADLFNDTVDLAVSLGSGLGVRARTSPLKPVRFRADKPDWTEWLDVGGAGTFSFQVPEFAFDFAGGRWHASGGIARKGPLAIPLKPIKWLLEKGGFPTALLDHMPSRIPLREIDLRSPDCAHQVGEILGHLDPTAKALFEKLAGLLRTAIGRLPERLEDYFVLNIPKGLVLDMAVEPTGGFAFEVGVEGDEPLKVLLPAVLGVTPGLMGLKVHRVSFGLTGGGSVAVLKTDGWADWQDLPGLIYALVTGAGKNLSNRLTMRDTVALVPTAVPLPIPLFYSEFGWDYRDPFGIGLAYHARFPEPQPTVQEWFALIGELYDFFTKPGFYLHDQGIPKGMALPFTFEGGGLSLPSYLGGTTLGLAQPLPSLSVANTLARALDGIKAGNVGWIIQSIPLKWPKTGNSVWIRVGHENISFGPLSITAAWCITTKDEFVNEVLPDPEAMKALAVANAENMLDSLPEKFDGGKPYDKGFVILLMGGLAARTPLADIFDFTCQFGIASMGPKDFETGVRLRGRFGPGNTLVLGIEGRIKTQDTGDGESIVVSVGGEIYLIVAGQRLALSAGLTIVPGRSFEGFVTLELSNYVTIGGTLTVDANGVAIDGHVHWKGISGPAEGFATGAHFSREGVLFTPFAVTIGGFECGATVRLPGKRVGDVFTIGVAIVLPEGFADTFKASLKAVADDTVTRETSDAFDLIELLRAQIDSFEASLRGLQDWLPDLCAGIIKQINDGVSDKSVDRKLDKWAGKNLARKAAVAAAKPTARKRAKERAAPWITKLKIAHDAAAHSLDENYRQRLQDALGDLIKPNEITITTGKILGFPGTTVFSRKPLLKTEEKINQAIDAIGKLPATSEKKVNAEAVFSRLPTKQQVLATVRHAVDKGLDQGIPGVRSVGFETSIGLLTPGAITISAVLTCPDKPPLTVSAEVDLTRPDLTAKALTNAFAATL